MKAFIVDRYRKQSALRFGEMPEPEVRDHDVLVAIHAAALNVLDAKIRDGEFKLILPYRLPLILGNDVAGVVVRGGSKVRRFKAGDEVYARPNQNRIGTFAELIALDETDVALKPTNLTMDEAAYHKALTSQTGALRAEGRVLTIGRRVAFAEAKLIDATGRLYASATSTLLVIEQ